MQRKTGIYKISNLVNGKFYIGSASRSLTKRKESHFRLLLSNKHYNYHLQSAFNKYGENNFIFEILEECPKIDCLEKEQYYLDTLLFAQEYINGKSNKFMELGYNINPISNSRIGAKMTEEQKLKANKFPIGNIPWNKGGKWSEEVRKKLSNSRKGKPNTESQKEKISKSLKGRIKSKEHLENIAKSLFGKGRQVLQYDVEGNFIKEWNSLKTAERALNIKNISRCCTGKYKKVGGYIWKYKQKSSISEEVDA